MAPQTKPETLRTLPGDDVRQILWRFADRYDLQMLVQSARSAARGPVARLVAAGGRNSHEWTPEKAELLGVFDAAGLTSVFMEPDQGGYLTGPKNLAQALVALSQLLTRFPQIQEVDLNPVLAFPGHEGIVALDARIRVGP
jgi:hypothetical protein